jgi:hypothetical protein
LLDKISLGVVIVFALICWAKLEPPTILTHWFKWLAWIIVVALAAYALVSEGIRIYGRHFKATAKVEAKIYDTRTESADNDVGGGVEYTVGEYEFRVNRRLYNGETTGDFQPGDVITVVYNPADPTQNREETDTQDFQFVFLLGIVVAIFLFQYLKNL